MLSYCFKCKNKLRVKTQRLRIQQKSERIRLLSAVWNLQYIYQNKLDVACI